MLTTRQYFARPTNHLVHDPNNSLRIGDVVEISPGWRVSPSVRHVVNKIISPFGTPIEERPPIPTPEERIAARETKKKAKEERRMKGKIVLREGKAEIQEE
jgi:small subunit ribosomal protein S17